MLLSKQMAVCLNFAECRLKQYTSSALRRANIDLTPEQFLLLDLLWNQGTMTQQKMADTMRKDKNSITNLVDALERKGYVVRRQSASDRRSNMLVLTETAEALKQKAKEVGIYTLDSILAGISDEEISNFIVVLERMTANMDRELLDNQAL